MARNTNEIASVWFYNCLTKIYRHNNIIEMLLLKKWECNTKTLTLVMWDVENVGIPRDCDAQTVIAKIWSRLRDFGDKDAVDIKVFIGIFYWFLQRNLRYKVVVIEYEYSSLAKALTRYILCPWVGRTNHLLLGGDHIYIKPVKHLMANMY